MAETNPETEDDVVYEDEVVHTEDEEVWNG